LNTPDGLQRIKTDGTNLTMILSGFTRNVFRVIDDWIYYVRRTTGEAYMFHPSVSSVGTSVFRIKTDGTGKTEVAKDEDWNCMVADGEWLYYQLYNTKNGTYNLYKIKFDGTGKQLLTTDTVSNRSFGRFTNASYSNMHIRVSEGFVYYSYSATSGGNPISYLCRIKTDGTGKTKLKDFTTTTNNADLFIYVIHNDWIYLNTPDGLQRIKTDGTGLTTIVSRLERGVFRVIDDWIYYSRTTRKNNSVEAQQVDYYKMKTDGTGDEHLFIVDTSVNPRAIPGGGDSSNNDNNNNTPSTPATCTVCPGGRGWDDCRTCDGRGTLNGNPCPNFRCSGGRVDCLATLNH
jgi:hypothetical protein